MRFSIIERKIILAPEKVISYIKNERLIQQQVVTGRITDASTGELMPGVNIQVKGTTLGTLSDLDGRYTIAVPDPNATLIFSFIGRPAGN